MSLAQAQQQVRDMMTEFGQQMPTRLTYDGATPDTYSDLRILYRGLVREEFREFDDADTFSDEIDAVADLLVVLLGFCNAAGVEIQPIFDAVMQANMTKSTGPICETTGKRLKPEGFKHPDIDALLKEQRKAGAE